MPRPLALLAILLLLFSGFATGGEGLQKIKGVAIVGPPKEISNDFLAPIIALNADHVCIMPYSYGPAKDGGIFYQGLDWQWWGERKDGVRTMVKEAHDKGMKVLLKPHIWMMDGQFTGRYDPGSEDGWKAFERSYETYIMDYAWLAQELDVELFCIGTELHHFVDQRPTYWTALIENVRNVYHGQLTYAGNWDSFEEIPFWNEMDLIGIDAYFPLSTKRTPEVKELKKGWMAHYKQIEKLQHEVQKPVAFLEYGYRSMDRTAEAPWESGKGNKVNLEAQRNAYQALFELFWEKPWFVGGFAWKWHLDHQRAGGPTNTRFTPQNKPAEQVIRKRYSF